MARNPNPATYVSGKYAGYLRRLEQGMTFFQAMQDANLSRANVSMARKFSREFRDTEARLIGERTPETMKADFLYFLNISCGNELRARRQSQISKSNFEMIKRDPAFIKEVEEVYKSLIAEGEEQLTKAALGRKTKLKDPNFTLKVLGKWLPDKYGDKPRIIEHHHLQGEALDAELDRLLKLPQVIEDEVEPDTARD